LNSGGSPVLLGSLVMARPSVLYAVRWFPSLITRLLMLRSIGLWALSMPVTAVVAVGAVCVEVWPVVGWTARGLWWLTVGLSMLVGVFGAVLVVVGLVAAVFAWKLWLGRKHPDFDLDPWLVVVFLCVVGVPVALSWSGLILAATALVEVGLGVVSPQVRVID
jgi:hypothetical protein